MRWRSGGGWIAAVVLSTLVVAGCTRDAADRDRAQETSARAAGTGVRADLLVDVAWLEEMAGASDVVLLHVAVDSADFLAGHVPGAQYLALSAVVIDRDGIPNELPPLDEVRAAFEARGVSDDRHVVVYGEPLHAARAFLALDVLGHDRVSLLDGGLAAWRAAGSSAVVSAAAGAGSAAVAGRMTHGPRPDLIWTAADVYELMGDARVVLLDARPPAQFAGADSPGRIPTAQSLFWENTLASPELPLLRPLEELQAMFAEAGARDDRQIITYCRTGMQAGFLYFVARYLGHDVRIYDGSFADWSSNPHMPIETD